MIDLSKIKFRMEDDDYSEKYGPHVRIFGTYELSSMVRVSKSCDHWDEARRMAKAAIARTIHKMAYGELERPIHELARCAMVQHDPIEGEHAKILYDEILNLLTTNILNL